jgi:hypothetical protein
MKLIYIAGAYRSRSLLGVVCNIFRARQVAQLDRIEVAEAQRVAQT